MAVFFLHEHVAENFWNERVIAVNAGKHLENNSRCTGIRVKEHVITGSFLKMNTTWGLLGHVENFALECINLLLEISIVSAKILEGHGKVSLSKEAEIFLVFIKIIAETQISLIHFRQDKQRKRAAVRVVTALAAFTGQREIFHGIFHITKAALHDVFIHGVAGFLHLIESIKNVRAEVWRWSGVLPDAPATVTLLVLVESLNSGFHIFLEFFFINKFIHAKARELGNLLHRQIWQE